jgi:hypothetical protein
MAEKDFVVKNGLIVNSSLIFANSGKVGIMNTAPDAVLTVTGTANVSGNVVFGQKLNVTGAATLSNTLAITGATTLSNTLAVTNTATFSNTVAITGAATFSNTVAITGATTLLRSCLQHFGGA